MYTNVVELISLSFRHKKALQDWIGCFLLSCFADYQRNFVSMIITAAATSCALWTKFGISIMLYNWTWEGNSPIIVNLYGVTFYLYSTFIQYGMQFRKHYLYTVRKWYTCWICYHDGWSIRRTVTFLQKRKWCTIFCNYYPNQLNTSSL